MWVLPSRLWLRLRHNPAQNRLRKIKWVNSEPLVIRPSANLDIVIAEHLVISYISSDGQVFVVTIAASIFAFKYENCALYTRGSRFKRRSGLNTSHLQGNGLDWCSLQGCSISRWCGSFLPNRMIASRTCTRDCWTASLLCFCPAFEGPINTK
jgi:hypothetical protein